MVISDIFGALEAQATLIGLPFFAVLMGLLLLSIELFVLAVFMLFAVWRIRKEMINMNRKIDLMVQPSVKGSEIESDFIQRGRCALHPRKKMIIGIILIISLFLPQYGFAQQQTCPFSASAAAAILMDAHTGQILYSQNPHLRMQPASLVKLMTLYLIFDALDQGQIQLNSEVLISKKAAQAGGSKMYLREGSRVPLVELIKGIAVVSGNDACLAVAERLNKDERVFVERMNQKLKDLRIQNSQFQTVDGWPAPDQYTTAYDMAMLAQAYIQDHPEALQYHRLKEFTHENHILHNRNNLVFQDPSVDGLKTGHVEEAGYHLLATAQRGKQRFIAAVLGAEKIEIREKEALQLLNFGFNNFTTVRLFGKGQILSHLPVSKGIKDRVGIAAQEDGRVTIPVSQKEHVSLRIQPRDQAEAPIELNQELGDAIISDQKNIYKTIPLLATEQIQRAGFIQIFLQGLEIIIARHKASLFAMIILIGIIVLQTWHIKKLRRQFKDHLADENLIKERLNKILKPTKVD